MSNNLGSLVVSLGLDAAQFTAGLSKADRQAQQWADKFVGAIESARVAALGSAAAIGAAYAVLDRQLESLAGFQDIAEKMGDTALNVASLQRAVDVSGVSFDTLSTASVKLTAALAKSDDESKGAALGLAAIGIEVDAFKKLSPVEQLDAVAQALAKFEDGAGKTATAVQIFGRSGAELMPILNDLADGSERQTRLTEEQIAAADEYSKSTARLRSDIAALAGTTAADAAPAMRQIVELLRDVLRYSTDAAGGFSVFNAALGGVKATLQVIAGIGSDVVFVFQTLRDTLGAYGAFQARFLSGDLRGALAVFDSYDEISKKRRADLDAFQARLMGTAPPPPVGAQGAGRPSINTAGFSGGGGGKAAAARAGKGNEKSLDLLAEEARIKQEMALLNEMLANTESARLQKQRDEMAKAVEWLEKGLVTEPEYLEMVTARLRLVGKSMEENLDLLAEEARVKQEMALLNEMLAGTESARLQKQRDEMAKAVEWLEKGLVTEAEYVEMVTARLGLVAQSTTEAVDQAKRLGDAFANTFDSAFRGGMKLGDLLKKLAFDAINIQFLTPAAQQAGTWLGGMVSNAFKPGGLLSFAGGGYTGNGGRGGGLDGQGGFLAMLHPRETVVDHTTGGGAGGGAQLVQHITIDARGADAGVESRIRAAMAQTKAETLALVQSRANRGGSFAASLGRA